MRRARQPPSPGGPARARRACPAALVSFREMITNEYMVTGMTCEHCVGAVSGALRALPGVDGVEVDLISGRVTVVSAAPVDRGVVASAVAEAGYQLV